MSTATDITSELVHGVATPVDLASHEPTLARRAAGMWELTKPRLNTLVLVTTGVGAYMAAGWEGLAADPLRLVHLLGGTALTAAGAGALNQWVERVPDGLMHRTRRRPLPAGVLSPGLALGAGICLAAAGTIWLAGLVNVLTASLALFTLLSYVLVYTPLKRRSAWNTLVGAVPGAIPPMLGVTAFAGEVTPVAWALFAILFVWQMPHFFGLAMLFADDYRRGGYVMLPTVEHGPRRTARQVVFWCVLMVPVSLLPVAVGAAGWWYAAAALLLGGWFLRAGLKLAASGQKPDARRLFVTSIVYLPLLLSVLMLDRV